MRAKQIPIRGQKLTTPIAPDTPLDCLLDEGKIFGEDFKDKSLPELPHGENCQCELTGVIRQSHDWFNNPPEKDEKITTDLGRLERNEYRYYKYMLIAHHQDSEDADRQTYVDLAENVSVAEDFKERVANKLSVINKEISSSM